MLKRRPGRAQDTRERLMRIEARLDRLEALAGEADDASGSRWLTLREVSGELTHQFAVQADRLAALHLKLDMTHSRAERTTRVLDEMQQVQSEHSAVLAEIEDRLPVRPPA